MKVFGSISLLAMIAPILTGMSAFAGSRPAHFHLTNQVTLGGEGGWDALTVDAGSHRLFVTHGTRVEVLDLDSNRVVGTIEGTPGVHGVALATALGRGYTSNGRDSSVSVFDLKTLAPLARIALDARNPDAIVFDAASGRVFAFNGGSANATAIDARTDSIVGTVPLGGKPEFAVEDGQGRMFVNLEDSSAVLVFDTRTLRPVARWNLAPGEEPTGIALDRAHGVLFAACSNRTLVALRTKDGHLLVTLPIGEGVDGAAFDARRGLVFTSNGDGTLSVIREESPERFSVAQTVVTQRGARTLAIDEGRGSVYLVTSDFGPAPAPTPERPHPRPSVVAGTFRVLEVRE